MTKKLISVLLSLIMIMTSLPLLAVHALAEEVPQVKVGATDYTSEDGQWIYHAECVVGDEILLFVKKYLGKDSDVVIPSVIDGRRVIGVGPSPTYSFKEDMVSIFSDQTEKVAHRVTLSEGIECIARNAFDGETLEELKLPASLKFIQCDAFKNAVLQSFHFVEGLEGIDNLAFNQTTFSDTSIVLPQSLKFIDKNAFSRTNITSVLIGANADVTSSYYYAHVGVLGKRTASNVGNPFALNESLTNIEIDLNNPYLIKENGVVYSKGKHYLISAETGYLDVVNIPDETIGICENAFYNCHIDSLTVGRGIDSITANMFNNTDIGTLRFANDGVLYEIPASCFSEMKIEQLILSGSIRVIGEKAFYKSGIETVTFPDDSQLEIIGKNAFEGNLMTSIDLSSCPSLHSILDCAFKDCKNLKTIDLRNTPLHKCILATAVSENLSTGHIYYGCDQLTTVYISDYFESNYDNPKYVYSNPIFQLSGSGVYDNETVISSGEYDDTFAYSEYEDYVVITKYLGMSGTTTDVFTFPDEINGKPVKYIAPSFMNGDQPHSQKELHCKTVVFPKHLKCICAGFQNIEIEYIDEFPEELEYIQSFALYSPSYQSGLKRIPAFPKSLKYIGKEAFRGNDIESVQLNEGLEYIGDNAFAGNPIVEWEIPDSLVYFGVYNINQKTKRIHFGANVKNIFNTLYTVEHAKTNAFSPEEITVSEDNPWYSSDGNILYNAEKSELLLCPFMNTVTSYTIPDTVEKIRSEAFYKVEKLQSLQIPSSIKSIGKKAFYKANLKEVFFHDGFDMEILDSTFEWCILLEKVRFGNNTNVTNMVNTFRYTNLQTITFPSSVKLIDGAFYMSRLTRQYELNLPDGLEYIGDNSFAYTNIIKLVVPESVKEIGTSAFDNCSSMRTADIGNVKILGALCFACCYLLSSIDLTGVRFVTGNFGTTFSSCYKLTEYLYTKEHENTVIPADSIKGNDTIETVVIGSSVSEIQEKAFADCTNLEAAVISDKVETIADSAFENCEKLTIYCVANSVAHMYALKNQIKFETFSVEPIPDQTYTGKALTPALKVTQGGKTLTPDTDYAALYSNNVNVGMATVSVVGKGDYKVLGTTVRFKIIKAATPIQPSALPSLPTAGSKINGNASAANVGNCTPLMLANPTLKVKAAKKSAKLRWEKVAGTTKYVIQYATNRKFRKAKTKVVSGSKVTVTLKRLKKGKRYYFRVRAVSGKAKSAWSNGKSVKIQ